MKIANHWNQFSTISAALATTLLANLVTGAAAFALPLKPNLRAMSAQLSQHLPIGFTGNYNFRGIVALDDCSGSLIRFDSSQDSDKAMVLTNGHCIESGFPAPGTIVIDQPSSRDFAILDENSESLGDLQAEAVLYSSMTKTDMTLYRLQSTYAEIKAQYGIEAMHLVATHPVVGTKIEVISGYWRRGYACAIEAFIPKMREGDWSWQDSIRYSRPGCEVIGGTSGSPVVEAGTRNVIGINNTTNESGEECTVNNPCEVGPNGETTHIQGYSYGQETFWLYSCLKDSQSLDLNKAGCQLFH